MCLVVHHRTHRHDWPEAQYQLYIVIYDAFRKSSTSQRVAIGLWANFLKRCTPLFQKPNCLVAEFELVPEVIFMFNR